jgi:hypothetical protein
VCWVHKDVPAEGECDGADSAANARQEHPVGWPGHFKPDLVGCCGFFGWFCSVIRRGCSQAWPLLGYGEAAREQVKWSCCRVCESMCYWAAQISGALTFLVMSTSADASRCCSLPCVLLRPVICKYCSSKAHMYAQNPVRCTECDCCHNRSAIGPKLWPRNASGLGHSGSRRV